MAESGGRGEVGERWVEGGEWWRTTRDGLIGGGMASGGGWQEVKGGGKRVVKDGGWRVVEGGDNITLIRLFTL